ncbi:MAG: DUF4185 domain-containing protein [Gemmatimonadaceae bacterium]|nr:DUF4185 domain-containing protein [Gemmatimonadaceae bacterium]
MRRRGGIALLGITASACDSSTTIAPPVALTAVGRAYAAADTLFRQDRRWLGGDAALTIPLSSGRTLWLFGDSFVSAGEPPVRSTARLPRNTIAVQTGNDPVTATMAFAWNQTNASSPTAFFPGVGTNWYWPGHGLRLTEGPLVVFLTSVRSTPGIGLGFVVSGYALAVIDNPDAEPGAWHVRMVDGPSLPFDAIPATAVVRDGDQVVALAVPTQGTKRGLLVRYSAGALASGNLSAAQWWTGPTTGWQPTTAVGTSGPTAVMDDAGAECSIHWDAQRHVFVHVASYGFGATTIGLRTAPAITGPWTAPMTVYRPPESDAAQPFVYAAKAHPTLTGPGGDLLVTHVANSFTFADLLSVSGQRTLYWPRMTAVHFSR